MQEAAKEAYQSAQDLVLLSPTGSVGAQYHFLLHGTDLERYTRCAGSYTSTFTRIGLQIETVFKSMELLSKP